MKVQERRKMKQRYWKQIWGLLLVSLLLAACNSEPEGPFTVAIVNSIGSVGEPTIAGFQSEMAGFGYVEGETIVYQVNSYDPAQEEEIATAVQTAVSQPADLIVVLGLPAALAAQQATVESKIPILFNVGDPISTGLVTDFRQPGGNITGVTSGVLTSDTEGRRLEWLIRMKPDIEKIYVINDPNTPSLIKNFEAVEETAANLGIEIDLVMPTSQEEVDALIANFPEDVEAFFPMGDRRLVPHVPELIRLSLERDFLFSTPVMEITRAGGLMAFSADYGEVGKQLAHLADQVLKGTDPGTLPVEEPEILLNVNLKTAEAIGLEIPDEVLEAAFEIIR
jgi:putative ABC transport system substrate-binding protein